MVPYAGRFETVGRRVLVAWNRSRESARALNDALPILKGASQVTVLSVNPRRGEDANELPGADIALHLARHGVKAEAASTVAEDIDVGNTACVARRGSGRGPHRHGLLRQFRACASSSSAAPPAKSCAT